MKGMLVTLGLLFAFLAAGSVSAATLYKCIGGDGIPSYGSKRIAQASCSVVSRFAPERLRAPGRPITAASRPATSSNASTTMAPIVAVPASHDSPRRRVSGQLYSYMKDGVRHYTSVRPTQTASIEGLRAIRYSFIEVCYACAVRPGLDFSRLRLDISVYRAEIEAAAREFGVEEAVVRAIIHAESAYNQRALSRAGAQGLMQLMPGTARRFGVGDVYDAGQNIRGGVQYLAWLLKRFDGDMKLAAAGYNAGEGAVARYRGVPPYAETQRYVQRVGILVERYRSSLASRQ